MAKLGISVLNTQGENEYWVRGEDEIHLVYPKEYELGDTLVFTSDEVPGFYVIRVDGAMDEAYVYLTQERLAYTIPFERNEYSKADRISYCLGSFSGPTHYITMRRARPEENKNFRNLAKNVMDQHDDVGCYPHVHANAETKGPIAPLFAARNAIDGVLANSCHYPWPFQSWGIDQREDAEITVEFGRPVDLEELRLTTRADFPHDSWWNSCTVRFSDGSSLEPAFVKTGERQIVDFASRTVDWLVVEQLIKDPEDPSPFPALTQLEAWGTEVM